MIVEPSAVPGIFADVFVDQVPALLAPKSRGPLSGDQTADQAVLFSERRLRLRQLASRVLMSCSKRTSPRSSSHAVSETAQYTRSPVFQNAK